MENLEHVLLEKAFLTQNDLNRAREVQSKTRNRLAETLVRLGLVPEEQLAALFVEVTGLPPRPPGELAPDCGIEGLSRSFLLRHALCPVARTDDAITVAMADPTDGQAVAALEFATLAEIQPCIATFSEIADALGRSADEAFDIDGLGESDSAGSDIARILEDDSDAPVIRLVQRVLNNAVMRRASDVHIEPMARYVSVRYRIDGRLQEVERHSDSLAAPMASRIKVMAGLDIAESRLPQDGRLRITVRGRDVDVRVSTSPIAHGESIVLRILGRTEVPLDLDRLGLPPHALATFHRALAKPHGIILVTGPTGSGKSTTLYAAVSRLLKPEVKILTVEDPVEVLIEGINQVQVRPEIGLSYAATLRAFLRQDPDILMIGEIRDRETADIALRSALTGHLVLSTLHTNSALGAFTRLADIGIEPYLTASTVIAAVAQRLVRALCLLCRQERLPEMEEVRFFESTGVGVPERVFEPAGCESCSGTGFAGRIPLIEIIEVDDALREQIRAGAVDDADPLGHANSLAGHGLALVAAGQTSFSEVMRAVALQ